MLVAPTETPYDLRFELAGTPVRVHPLFWLISAIFGWDYMRMDNGFALVGIWIACSFVSILVHEFGHVWAGQLFGTRGHIVLYSFGGLAIGSNHLGVRWQRIVVSLAGPGIQLALYGVMWALMKYVLISSMATWPTLALHAYLMMMFVNLYWPLFNLLPIWPLDGGMVSRELCEAGSPRDGTRISLIISIAAAVFLVINSVLARNGKPIVPYIVMGNYGMLLFAMLAFESFQLLQQLGSRSDYGDHWDDR